MAIGHILTGDTSSISKINAAIDKANLVDNKADTTALAAEVTARAAALTAEASTRAAAVSAEAAARAAADNNLQAAISNVVGDLAQEVSSRAQAVAGEAQKRAAADSAEAKARTSADEAEIQARQLAVSAEASARTIADSRRPEFGQSTCPIRPGEAIRFFTGSLEGNPTDVIPLPDSMVASSSSGLVARLSGAGIIAPVAVWRIEPAHVYRVRFVVRRETDTEDPSNDAVRLGVRWLNSNRTGATATDLANILDFTVSDGRAEYTFSVAATDAPDVDAAPPAGAVYFRPFVRTFGGGVTHVEVIEVVDATSSAVWSPDVDLINREIASLTAQVQALADRVMALEA